MTDVKIDWTEAPEWATVLLDNVYGGGLAWAETYSQNSKAVTQSGQVFKLIVGCWKVVEKRPNEWVGEGLPPVDTKCLYTLCLSGDKSNPVWYECKVKYVIENTPYQVGGVVALCHAAGGDIEQYLEADTTMFKLIPVKSAQDIEKEVCIETMLADLYDMWCDSDEELVEVLYKKGYRKL